MKQRSRRPTLRAFQGIVLASGAPIGWMAVEALRGASPIRAWQADPVLHTYLLGVTAVVFAVFGLLLGREEQLAAANRELADMTMTDSLTGIPNRRYFQHRLAEEAVGVQRGRVKPDRRSS